MRPPIQFVSFYFPLSEGNQEILERLIDDRTSLHLEETLADSVTVGYTDTKELVDFIFQLGYKEGLIEGRAYERGLQEYGKAGTAS